MRLLPWMDLRAQRTRRARYAPPVTIGFVPDDYAVLSTDGKPTTVVVMSDVIVNHSVGRPYFKTIDRPPSSSLRSIVTGTAATTDIARDGRSVRAAGALHKDAAARSRPVYSVAGDDAVASRKRNPKPLAHVVDDASVAGPDAGARTSKDRRSWWGRSGHRPANVVPFDRPVVTAGRGDSPPSAFDDRAVCHSLVVTLAGDSRQADRWGIVPHVRFSTLQLSPSHCSKWFVGIPSTFSTDTRRPSPTKCTSDETAGLCEAVMPELEMMYIPLGTRHTPPPASATDL